MLVAYQFGTLEETADHKVRPLIFLIFKVGRAIPSGIVNFPSRIDVMTGNLLALSVNFNGCLRRDRDVYPLDRTAFLSIPLPVFAKYYHTRCLVIPLLACLLTYSTRSIRRRTGLFFSWNCSNNRPPTGGYNVFPRRRLLPRRDPLPIPRLTRRA